MVSVNKKIKSNLDESFSYTSDRNSEWLSIDEIKKLLRNFD